MSWAVDIFHRDQLVMPDLQEIKVVFVSSEINTGPPITVHARKKDEVYFHNTERDTFRIEGEFLGILESEVVKRPVLGGIRESELGSDAKKTAVTEERMARDLGRWPTDGQGEVGGAFPYPTVHLYTQAFLAFGSLLFVLFCKVASPCLRTFRESPGCGND